MARKNSQARQAACRICGKDWQISALAVIPPSGYVCPVCETKQRRSDFMAMKTLKSVGSRTPQNINIELDTLPENESDALCRTIISGMSRAFEDPAVMADYQNWKKQRQQRKEAAAL